MSERIVANSVLPAHREQIELVTSDGLRLVGELALPEKGQVTATIVCVHPLPTHGGMMDSHVLRKMAWRLPALTGLAILRFNTRGTTSAAGTSDGAFDSARGEGLDLRAAIDFVVQRGLPAPWLLGWSFGTDVILKHGNVDPVAGAILLSPPLRFTSVEELSNWNTPGRPVVCLVPEHDDYLKPEEARVAFAAIRTCQVREMDDAKHLWVGEKQVSAVVNAIVDVVLPGCGPVPHEWAGPMERWSDL